MLFPLQPLDSFLSSPQAATAGGSSAPPSQAAPTSAPHTSHNSTKQAVPCIFFQKGLCLKGDRCAFSHGLNPNTSNKVPQVQVTNQVTEPTSFKKVFSGPEKSTQERKISQANVVKPAVRAEAKPAQNGETTSHRNAVAVERHVPPPPMGFDNEASRFKVVNPPPITNGATVARPNRAYQSHVSDDHGFHNGKESDEFLRESSPGFDVLVADELRNSDYYEEEDQFRKARGQDGMNLDSVDEYDLGHSVDYKSVADIDQERYCGPQGYDMYDHMQEKYEWDQRRNSSERMFRPTAHLERMAHRRSVSPENVGASDLRHRLSKRRRVNGLKSVVSHDYARQGRDDEQSRRSSSQKDAHRLPLNEGAISNRFRGRIKLPANGGDEYVERESDRGRNRRALSPGTMQAPHPGGRFRDRLTGRVQEDTERKNLRDRLVRRDLNGDPNADFDLPKSLSELRNGSNSRNKEHQFLGKRKSFNEQQQSEDDFLFDGPKPLSEILKEKREREFDGAFRSGKSSENKGDSKHSEVTNGSEHTSFIDAHSETLPANKEDVKNQESNLHETEDAYEEGMIENEITEDQEYEGDDQNDGEYYYEQGDEGEYNYEEGENPEQEEYIDEEDGEDGDDFAKKIGVMLT